MSRIRNRILVIVTIAVVLIVQAICIYLGMSAYVAKKYRPQIADQLLTHAENAVYFEQERQLYPIKAENMDKLLTYLSSNAALGLERGAEEQEKILMIGEDALRIAPVGEDGDRAVVYYEIGDESYRMGIRRYRLWEDIDRLLESAKMSSIDQAGENAADIGAVEKENVSERLHSEGNPGVDE